MDIDWSNLPNIRGVKKKRYWNLLEGYVSELYQVFERSREILSERV